MRRLADFGYDGNATKVTSDGWVMGSAELAPYEETPVVWDPQGRIYDVYGMVDPQTFYPVQDMGLNDQPGAIGDVAVDQQLVVVVQAHVLHRVDRLRVDHPVDVVDPALRIPDHGRLLVRRDLGRAHHPPSLVTLDALPLNP